MVHPDYQGSGSRYIPSHLLVNRLLRWARAMVIAYMASCAAGMLSPPHQLGHAFMTAQAMPQNCVQGLPMCSFFPESGVAAFSDAGPVIPCGTRHPLLLRCLHKSANGAEEAAESNQ